MTAGRLLKERFSLWTFWTSAATFDTSLASAEQKTLSNYIESMLQFSQERNNDSLLNLNVFCFYLDPWDADQNVKQ